jgi:Domain of unknown function DUF11
MHIVTNAGPGKAQSLTITDSLPAGVSLVPTSSSLTFSGSSRGSCTGAPTVTCTVDGLDSGATATLRLVVTVGVAGTLTNSVTVTAASTDPNAANNAATTTTAVGAAQPPPPPANCAPSYPTVCIPPPPPDLDCGQIPYRDFQVIYTVPSPDPPTRRRPRRRRMRVLAPDPGRQLVSVKPRSGRSARTRARRSTGSRPQGSVRRPLRAHRPEGASSPSLPELRADSTQRTTFGGLLAARFLPTFS